MAKKKEEVEVHNQADSLIHSTEKSLTDLGDKVPQDLKDSVNTALEDLKGAKNSSDIESVKTKMQHLQEVSMKLGEMIYKEQAQSAQGEPQQQDEQAQSKDANDNVVDAEFKEK